MGTSIDAMRTSPTRRGEGPFRLGMRMHKLRKQHGMTLQQVADASGFSRSLISKIETGKVTPPVATLSKIAAALGVTVSELLAEAGNGTTIHTRAGAVDDRGLTKTDKGYAFFAFATERADKLMQPYLFVARKGEIKGQSLSHAGEEFVYVTNIGKDRAELIVTYDSADRDIVHESEYRKDPQKYRNLREPAPVALGVPPVQGTPAR